MATSYESLKDIGAIDINGKTINKLKDIIGDKKCTMVVNIATQSPMADFNMEALNELYDRYSNDGFEILLFPCNQFHKMEPNGEHDIKNEVISRWGVNYPIFHKVKVNGSETDEVFKFLRSQTPELVDRKNTPNLHEGRKVGVSVHEISGNFCKWLVDEHGHVVDFLPNEVDDPRKLEQRIRKFLGLSHMK